MKKILYAEDNSGMRKMISHFLDASGFVVVACEDGEDAVELARKDLFDVIIMDVTMERMDGITATKIIRELDNNNANIPVLGLTARTEADEINHCIDAGMDVVVNKPVDLEALVGIVLTIAHKKFNPHDKVYEKFRPRVVVIDIDILVKYHEVAGTDALEGILSDFCDLWPIKICELYNNLIHNRDDAFVHSSEELAAIAAGIGAGLVHEIAERAAISNSKVEKARSIEELIEACIVVQNIINSLQLDAKMAA